MAGFERSEYLRPQRTLERRMREAGEEPATNTPPADIGNTKFGKAWTAAEQMLHQKTLADMLRKRKPVAQE